MRSKAAVIGIAVSDIHLSMKPPICRDEESDWFLAMRRPLVELSRLRDKYKVPIFCPGDIFHKWNSTPELINFALKFLPPMFSVPGQHDLPHHSYADIEKSAYWTLVEAGRINNIGPGTPWNQNMCGRMMSISGFPWGTDLREASEDDVPNEIKIALIHRYVWKEKSLPIDDHENCFSTIREKLNGFTFAIFGDNHQGFIIKAKSIANPTLINCGSLMRRSSLQKDYRPFVGLLYSDGTVEPYFMNISKESFRSTSIEAELMDDFDLSAFVEQIEHLEEYKIDFEETVRRFITEKNVDEGIADKLIRAMEE